MKNFHTWQRSMKSYIKVNMCRQKATWADMNLRVEIKKEAEVDGQRGRRRLGAQPPNTILGWEETGCQTSSNLLSFRQTGNTLRYKSIFPLSWEQALIVLCVFARSPFPLSLRGAEALSSAKSQQRSNLQKHPTTEIATPSARNDKRQNITNHMDDYITLTLVAGSVKMGEERR